MNTPRTNAKLIAEISPLVRAALTAQLAKWDAERQIEEVLGGELDMGETIENACVTLEDPEGISDDLVAEVAEEFVNEARVDISEQ